jgi:beta-galactosidase
MAVNGFLSQWIADVEPRGATTLLTFSEGVFAGQPAVTLSRHKKGRAFYIASGSPNGELIETLLTDALASAGVKPEIEAPADVDIVRRGRFLFLINHADQECVVELRRAGLALLGQLDGTRVRLAPYDVCIVEERI